jgi:malate synthase
MARKSSWTVLIETILAAFEMDAQVWRWIRHPRGVLSDGRKVTTELFRSVLEEEPGKIQSQVGQERYKKVSVVKRRSPLTESQLVLK